MRSFFSASLVVLAVAGILAVAVGPARAELIAYDGFGTSGNLNGSTGSANSTGFSAAWTSSPTGTGWNTGGTQLTPGMTMPSNYVGGEGGHVDIRTDNQTNLAANRPLSTSIGGDSGDTVYFSFEAQRSDATSNANQLVGLVSDTGLTNRIQFGFSGTGTAGANSRGYLYIKSGDGADHVLVDDLAGFDPKFYVAKVVTHTDGSIDFYAKLYANTDTLPDVEPIIWDMQIVGHTGFDDVDFSLVSINGKSYVNYGPATYGNKLDEFRLGTTWQDVAPIPEPSTLALLACGLIGLLAHAWRRRK